MTKIKKMKKIFEKLLKSQKKKRVSKFQELPQIQHILIALGSNVEVFSK